MPGVVFISSMKIFAVYMLSVISHGSLGMIFFLSDFPGVRKILGLGLLLFMVSDYFLALECFGKKKTLFLRIMNVLTYFTGMMLVTISMGY